MDLETKQVVCNAKYQSAVCQKNTNTQKMEELNREKENSNKLIQDMNRKVAQLKKRKEKQEKEDREKEIPYFDVQDIQAKISEVKDDIHAMIKYNSTMSQQHSALISDLEDERIKRMEAKVALELLKDREQFAKGAVDQQLSEKIQQEQRLYKLKAQEGELLQQKIFQDKIL